MRVSLCPRPSPQLGNPWLIAALRKRKSGFSNLPFLHSSPLLSSPLLSSPTVSSSFHSSPLLSNSVLFHSSPLLSYCLLFSPLSSSSPPVLSPSPTLISFPLPSLSLLSSPLLSSPPLPQADSNQPMPRGQWPSCCTPRRCVSNAPKPPNPAPGPALLTPHIFPH